jgi:hypothetical protein
MVNIIIYNSEKWQDFLGEGAKVLVLSYGVVISLILINSINMIKQEVVARKLFTTNPAIIYSLDEIKRVIWLIKHKPGKHTNAIIVDFYSKDTANTYINARKITWEGALKLTQWYSKKA